MKRFFLIFIGFFATLLSFITAGAQQKTDPVRYPLIPYPTHLQPAEGVFKIKQSTRIVRDKLFTNEAAILQLFLKKATGYAIPISDKSTSRTDRIVLQQDPLITSPEGYRLDIHPGKIILDAKSPAGIFRGIETIRQLLPVFAERRESKLKNVSLPAVKINDAPQYSWRGMHLDVARHFFSIGYLKKFIDVMALYKMNKLHLHLTDDQGWRIEIKKYPKLTEEGAWRSFNNQDSDCIRMSEDNPDMAIDTEHIIKKDGKILYGGFYTQEQMKGLVAYAAARHIDIIPEVDMPGHMMAAIHAYPFLTCDGGSKWGKLFSTPICPCNETTFEFAENVYREIFSVFPYEYVHLGADEVDRKEWAKSPACTELMQKEGLKNVDELQSYFVKRMEKFFNANGKKLIGWDEILEGGVSKTAYVMYWRSWIPSAPVKAAKGGNFVIMTPGDPLYFDRIPDARSIKEVYDFKVVPNGLTDAEAKFILGAQANIWTERIPSENRADYMYMPRMTALAERLWSNTNDFDSYLLRLQQQYKRLDALNVHYRLPDLEGMAEQNVFIDQTTLQVKKTFPGEQIHYTADGTIPVASSPLLEKPLQIQQPLTIKLAAFSPNHKLRGDIYTLNYTKETYAVPVTVNEKLKTGLRCSYYKQFFKTSTALKNRRPDSQFIATDFVVPAGIHAPSFGLKYKGFLNVAQTGIYTFYLTCDDGGILSVANREVVNNDGLHPAIEKTGQVALQKGLQPFELDFIEGGGGFKLELKYSKGNAKPHDIDGSWLKYDPGKN